MDCRNSSIGWKLNHLSLKPNQFTTSNDLYGSFCRARITVVSDDQAINEKLGSKAVAYFAVGDAFECGSWIDSKTMEAIEKEVKKGEGMSSWKKKAALAWSTVGGALLGGTAGGLVGNYLANGQIGGNGLLNSDAKVNANNKTNAGSCVNNLNKCLDSTSNLSACRAGLRDARAAGVNTNVNWDDFGSTEIRCTDRLTTVNDSGYIWCPNVDDTNQKSICTSNSNSWCCNDETKFKNGVEGKCINSKGDIKAQGEVLTQNIATGTGLNNNNKNQIEKVLAECQNKVRDNKSSATATGLGVGIGAVTGGLLGFGISKTVVDAKDAQAKDKALAEWRAALGEHIRCYLGSEDVAGYGEYVSFNFEDMN